VEERFWEKVDKNGPGGCWLWTAHVTAGGYGQFTPRHHKHESAHRFAYALLVGPIPEGMTLDHACRVPRCVRPEHLRPMPIGPNVLGGVGITAINARKATCHRGHRFSQANTYVRADGSRACKTCQREAERRYRERRRAKAA
jgi:hypothetical protein